MNGLPLWALLTVFSVPTFTAILGVLLNQRSMDRLADRLDHRMERIENRMERSDDELQGFRKQMHDEYIGLLNMIGDHGQRIVRLEERGSRSS